ncbi:MAG: zinc-dependent alcohol dehydrogenase family protein [Pseudomonadota bacterium]
MKAMMFEAPGLPLRLAELPRPKPAAGEILLEVRACGVCRTDLHVMDGDLRQPKLPLILGHEIVGVVVDRGANAQRFVPGERVGVPWLGRTCGHCAYCVDGRENLCDEAQFTGYTLDGGYAEFTLADERYCFSLPDNYADAEAAPLLCAGLIGYRALVAAGEAKRIGIYGFGAAAHIVAQVARWQGREIYAFTKPGDADGQNFARELGAVWAGDSSAAPPQELDAAILFAPVGALIPQALRHSARGGTVVCAGIHMSDVPQFPYSILWGERSLRSIANLTRSDGEAFLDIAPKAGVKTEVETFPLTSANEALERLRAGTLRGAAVLMIG